MIDINAISTKIIEQALFYAPKLLVAIVTLFIGLWIIKLIINVLKKQFKTKNVDSSLRYFLASLVSIALKVLLIITVISMLGVQMTSFVAVIGAAGLAIGLALQGSLANFAGGVLILLFKPFKVGDFIEAQGHFGKVDKILIFSTFMTTPDNKTVIIPNGPLAGGNVVNYSKETQRRVDVSVGIGYDDDIKKARKVIKEVIDKNKKILKDPKPEILVSELGDSSVNFTVRPWCKGNDYWDVFFYLNEEIKLALDKNKISIPFPQSDVHLYKH